MSTSVVFEKSHYTDKNLRRAYIDNPIHVKIVAMDYESKYLVEIIDSDDVLHRFTFDSGIDPNIVEYEKR